MKTFQDLQRDNEHLHWLIEEQRLQIRDLEMDITLRQPQQSGLTQYIGRRAADEAIPTHMVKQYAARMGVHERTIWRQIKSGKTTKEQIMSEDNDAA